MAGAAKGSSRTHRGLTVTPQGMNVHNEPLEKTFPVDKLVYLSPDATEVLERVEQGKVTIADDARTDACDRCTYSEVWWMALALRCVHCISVARGVRKFVSLLTGPRRMRASRGPSRWASRRGAFRCTR